MTATIISFPKKNNDKPKRVTKKIKFDVPNIMGVPVTQPRNRQEYLLLCKQHLDLDNYKEILCGIMDKDYFDTLDRRFQKVINSYFSFSS